MLLRLGRFNIDCQYIGIWRCEAPLGIWEDYSGKPINWEWKPRDCRECYQCRSFEELPEARIKQEA